MKELQSKHWSSPGLKKIPFKTLYHRVRELQDAFWFRMIVICQFTMSLSTIWSEIFLVKLGQTRRMLNRRNKWNSKYLSCLFSFNWVQYEFQNSESGTATDMIKHLPFFIIGIPRAIMGLGNTQCSRRQYLDYWLNILRSLRNILPPKRNVCTINHIIVIF